MSELTVDTIAKVAAKLKILNLALEHPHLSDEAAKHSFYLLQEAIDQLTALRGEL